MNDRSYALPAIMYRDPSEVIEYVQEQANFEVRLANWIRWARVRRWQSLEQAFFDSIRCHSIEHRHTPENLGDDSDEDSKRRNAKWPTDMLDAWEVECTWRRLWSAQFRYVLVFTLHRNNWDDRRICRALEKKGCGIHHARVDDLFRRAKAALRNKLR